MTKTCHMKTDDVAHAAPTAAAMRWAGRGITALVLLFLAVDGAMKLVPIEPVVAAMMHLGYAPAIARGIGLIELACVLLLLFPRTALLGALLFTAVLGGAIASHLRVGDPLVSHTLFGVYLGVLMWGGLCLRDPRLRALLPWRRGA